LGIKVIATDTVMTDSDRKLALAQNVLAACY
jgi:hypothetical protein